MGDYWYLWALIIILIPITAFVCFKAAKASQQSREEKRKYMEEMDRMKALKDEFLSFTKENIESYDGDMLLEGMALIAELKLKKSANANSDFAALKDTVKNVYVLDSIVEENSVSTFFKKNTEPVTPLAANALREIGLNEIAVLFDKVYNMFDENNESTSIDFDRTQKIDEEFVSLFAKDKIKAAAALYIKRNAADFCEK